VNVVLLVIAGILIGLLCYLLLRRSADLRKSSDNLFLFIRFALVAAFLGLIGYTIYQNLDLSDLLVGLLWLAAGILLLSVVVATIEKLEQKFRQKKDSQKNNKTSLT